MIARLSELVKNCLSKKAKDEKWLPPFYASVKYAARQIVIADILLNDFCFVFCPNTFVTEVRFVLRLFTENAIIHRVIDMFDIS